MEFYAMLKEAIFIDIYLKDTKDEQWLRKSQSGLIGQRWVDNIDEILKYELKTIEA